MSSLLDLVSSRHKGKRQAALDEFNKENLKYDFSFRCELVNGPCVK